MSQTFAPVVVDGNNWTPSMPNSDVWTLSSTSKVAPLVFSNLKLVHNTIGPNPIISRGFVPLRSSPLGRLPPSTASSLFIAAESPSSQRNTPTFAQTLQPARSRAAIGLGHPSASKLASSAPPESDPAGQASPTKRPRIDSSTIKRRTERFPARVLHSIAEHPVPTQKGAPRVPGARKRSYAEAASTAETPKQTDRRTTATTSPSPTFIPDSASKHRGVDASVSSMTALAPRSMSSGAPLAGLMQVQSPRVLSPITMAGSPNFQSLDGAILAIVAVLDEVIESEETRMDLPIYGEDRFLKLKVHTQIRIRFAARRLKTPF